MAATAGPIRKNPTLLRRWLTARGRSLEITKAGWLFVVLTLAVGFAAINSGSNLLHAIFGAQMALVIGSGILSEAMIQRAKATRIPTGPLYARSPGPVRVELRNADARADLFSVSVEDDDRVTGAGECRAVYGVRVEPQRAMALPSTVTMPRRGRHPLPPAVIATRFPFGLFIKRRELPVPREVIVYPHVAAELADRGHARRVGEGAPRGHVARHGEFFGLREYRTGDDLRAIHWPAVARLGKPVIREHEAESRREIVLRLRPGRTGDPAFESEVERLASTAVTLLRDGNASVGLDYGDQPAVPPGVGPAQERALLESLALVGDSSVPDAGGSTRA